MPKGSPRRSPLHGGQLVLYPLSLLRPGRSPGGPALGFVLEVGTDGVVKIASGRGDITLGREHLTLAASMSVLNTAPRWAEEAGAYVLRVEVRWHASDEVAVACGVPAASLPDLLLVEAGDDLVSRDWYARLTVRRRAFRLLLARLAALRPKEPS